MSDFPIRVLLIEDDSADAKLIRAYLSEEEDVPLVVDDVDRLAKGLVRLDHSDVDVVLLDLGLPDSAGLETVRQVLAHSPAVPVVVLTGAEVMKTALEAVRAGAADYLFKGRMDGPLLVRAIRFAVERAGRRRAVAQFQDAEARYRTLFEQSPDGVVLIAPDTLRAVEFNDAAPRQLGYDRAEFQTLCVCDYDVGDDPAPTQQWIDDSLQGPPTRRDSMFRKKSGELRHMVVTTRAIELSGRPLLYCVFRDITPRKKAEIRLQESEERFRSLVETTSDWIWEIDENAVYTYCSPRVTDLLGYTPQEIVGKSLYDLVDPKQLVRVRQSVEDSMCTQSALLRLEHTNVHRDGREIVLETSAVPVVDDAGRLRGYRGIDRDITEVKAVQDSLRERERRYGQLLAAVTNYTYTVNVENGRSVWTTHGEGCVSVTGYSPRDYADDSGLWLSMVSSEDREMVLEQVRCALRGDEVKPIEHRIVHRKGSTRWVRSTLVQHRENGILRRYDGVIEDITERKIAEEVIKRRELQLLAAQKIQKRLLPPGPPVLDGYDIGGDLYPAEFAAGDYYDYLPMRDGALAVVIGDVSGHSFASALIMAFAHVLLRLLVESHADVAEIFSLANSVLVKETEERRFVTMFLGRMDLAARSFSYANAAHPPGYILDAEDRVKASMPATEIPLGINPDSKYEVTGPIQLEEGDILVLVTDGILDCKHPQNPDDYFRMDRTLEVVRRNRQKSAQEIATRICREARAFSKPHEPEDDTTAVVIKVLAQNKPAASDAGGRGAIVR